jgi:hypothetical protein
VVVFCCKLYFISAVFVTISLDRLNAFFGVLSAQVWECTHHKTRLFYYIFWCGKTVPWNWRISAWERLIYPDLFGLLRRKRNPQRGVVIGRGHLAWSLGVVTGRGHWAWSLGVVTGRGPRGVLPAIQMVSVQRGCPKTWKTRGNTRAKFENTELPKVVKVYFTKRK